MLAIIESDHPEELLCGLPRGVKEERDAMLTSGAPVRWQFDENGQPVTSSRPLTFPSPISKKKFVLDFSDDGESRWVDVMVPGLGRCQVQRDDLVFYEAQAREVRPRCLRSGFQGSKPSGVAGLLRLLAAVEASLRYLEVGGVNSEVNIAKILNAAQNWMNLRCRAIR